uniref:NAD(P)-binding domain-containing protein n=1 Tax=Pyramimonas obovata TaxID=1411642 RepID=A0A7S0MS38_9CHLO
MAGSYWRVLFSIVLVLSHHSFSVTSALDPSHGDEVTLITGATGKTGALLYNSLVKAGHTVRGLVRSLEKAKEVLNCTSCDSTDGVYVGDVTDESTLEAPMEGVTRLVILTSSVPLKADNGSFFFPPGQYPKDVDFLGVKKQVISAKNAGVKHVLLCSSMGSTNPDNFLNKHLENVLFYKLNGEAVLLSSGVPFTIVKPGGLLGEDVPAGTRRLMVGHDDLLDSGVSSIPRADVAEVFKQAIENPEESQGARFDLGSDPSRHATGDFKTLFRDARDISVVEAGAGGAERGAWAGRKSGRQSTKVAH